jgi:hypothetical protein
MSKQWKDWHIELNEAIDKPTNSQLAEMEETHLNLYKLAKTITDLKEKLSECQEKFDDLKGTLNMEDLPNWAWIWIKKNSRVSWKDVVIKKLGQTFANKISAEAKQKEYPQIGIKFIDPNPEKIPIDPETKKHQKKPGRLNLTKETKTPLLKLKLG